jgi:hypothetical protein
MRLSQSIWNNQAERPEVASFQPHPLQTTATLLVDLFEHAARLNGALTLRRLNHQTEYSG